MLSFVLDSLFSSPPSFVFLFFPSSSGSLSLCSLTCCHCLAALSVYDVEQLFYRYQAYLHSAPRVLVPAIADDVDMGVYTRLADEVPAESSSVATLLDCMLDHVEAAAEVALAPRVSVFVTGEAPSGCHGGAASPPLVLLSALFAPVSTALALPGDELPLPDAVAPTAVRGASCRAVVHTERGGDICGG